MNTWYIKEFDIYLFVDEFKKLLGVFLATGHTLKTGYGVFSISDNRTVTFYFSPETQILANFFEASPCVKPSINSRLGLVLGDESSWQQHFSEKEQ